MDMGKVINALEYFLQNRICLPHLIPWAEISDALALLKQEAVAVHDPGAYCPKCGWMLYPEDHPHHCGNCGQAVKWE